MWPLGLIGPLAAWELQRLARRGLAMRVRLIFLYALLLAFIGFAAIWFQPVPVRDVFLSRSPTLSLAESAKFANLFALIFLQVQLVAIVAITPALAASAVSEEKDRQTLPLLFTTQLTDREIVFGKAAAHIAFVLAASFAGLPVLMLTLLFGGVDVGYLAAGYALTTGTVVLCAAIGVNAACHAPDLRSAILRAYGRVALFVCGAFIPPVVLASPFSMLALYWRDESSDVVRLFAGYGYPLLQVFVSLMLLVNAACSLRLRGATAGPPHLTAYPLPPRPAQPLLFLSRPASSCHLPPLDDANPVLWKERCVGWRPGWAMPAAAKTLAILTTALAAGLFIWGTGTLLFRVARSFDPAQINRLSRNPSAPDFAGFLLMSASVFAAGRYLLPVAVGISGAIAGERARRTLDPLLLTPLNRRAVLRAKVRAHSERGTGFAATAVIAIGMAFIADAGIRVGVAAAVLAATGFLFTIALGGWLTVRCQSDVRAFRLLLPLMMLIIGWPAAVWNLVHGELAVPPQLLLYGFAITAGIGAVAGLALWCHAERTLINNV